MTRRETKAQATRAHILDTARAMFDAHPYADVTARELARAAGLSTGAIFRYWADKDTLYREAVGHFPITPETGRTLLALATAGGLGDEARRLIDDAG